MPSPVVATTTPMFTPLAASHPRVVDGRIATAVVMSVLVVPLAITVLMVVGVYSMKSKDLTETQEEPSAVQQEFREAQEAAK